MSRAIPLFATLAVLAAAPAAADIPPPPYNGASHVTVAGLDLDRVDGHAPPAQTARPGPPYRRPFKSARVTACHGASRNCQAVTRAGVLGWAISKIDGQWVSYGDLDAVAHLIRAHGGTVRVTFTRIDGVAAGEKEVPLSAR